MHVYKCLQTRANYIATEALTSQNSAGEECVSKYSSPRAQSESCANRTMACSDNTLAPKQSTRLNIAAVAKSFRLFCVLFAPGKISN